MAHNASPLQNTVKHTVHSSVRARDTGSCATIQARVLSTHTMAAIGTRAGGHSERLNLTSPRKRPERVNKGRCCIVCKYCSSAPTSIVGVGVAYRKDDGAGAPKLSSKLSALPTLFVVEERPPLLERGNKRGTAVVRPGCTAFVLRFFFFGDLHTSRRDCESPNVLQNAIRASP